MKNFTELVSTQFFQFSNQDLPFQLRSGEALSQVTLAYEMYGELNSRKDNAILLFHALTGSQHAAGKNPSVEGLEVTWNEECQTGWWDGFIGLEKAIDLHKYCVMGQQALHRSVRKLVSPTELTSLKSPFQILLILR